MRPLAFIDRSIKDSGRAERTHFPLHQHVTHYNRACFTAPRCAGITDSFPGVLALLTGGSSKSHGVYYDDSYSRDLWCPGTPCNGSK